jgi:hypothetical protein
MTLVMMAFTSLFASSFLAWTKMALNPSLMALNCRASVELLQFLLKASSTTSQMTSS